MERCTACGEAAHPQECPYEIPMFRQPFVRIDDRLWQGSLALWQAARSGPTWPREGDVWAYPAWPTVDHIVILADARGDRRYSEWPEDHPVPEWPANVIWMPLQDDRIHGLFPGEWNALVALLRPLTEASVLTMCNAGENRSALASVLLCWLRGLPIDQAITYVRARVKPRYTNSSQVLWNPAFERQCRARCQP